MLTKTRKARFKKLLTRMLDEALARDNRKVEETNALKPVQPDPSDRSSSETELTFSLRMQERKGGLIRKIEEALERIEDGTYGICEECEEEISEDRLKARPITALCIKCKRKQEEYERFRE